MVRSGEETGKLSKTFTFLADYMERQYELTRKTKSALIYPAFVIVVFFVMIGMFVFIIPKLGEMILSVWTSYSFFYTKNGFGFSDF